ncbi:hypothetical protein [Amycolatopsis sp. NPDC006125]|uniref:zinc finger domain-containing protein n=1 Tax=Amycolatopsis sp. NPDC006125 TaxID=3156730 RepID=UPI0033A5A7B1
MTRRKPRGRDGRFGLFDNQPGAADAPAEIQDNPLLNPCSHCNATVRQPCTRPGPRGTRIPLKGFHDARKQSAPA